MRTARASAGRPGPLVSQLRLVPERPRAASGLGVLRRLAAGMVLLVFFSTPQNGVLTGKPWDVAAGHPAGPCVHAGPEPPGGQPWLHVVAVYQPCPRGPPVLTEAPWASSVFHLPVSVSRGRKGHASSCADLCDQSR